MFSLFGNTQIAKYTFPILGHFETDHIVSIILRGHNAFYLKSHEQLEPTKNK